MIEIMRLPMGVTSKLSTRASELGALGTANWLLYQVEWRFREWRLGIETQMWVTLDELGSPSLVDSLPVGQRNELADCAWLDEESHLSTGFWTYIETSVYQNRSSQTQANTAESPRRAT